MLVLLLPLLLPSFASGTAAATAATALNHKHYIRAGANSSPASSKKSSPGKTEDALQTPPPKAKPNAAQTSISASKKLQRARRLPSIEASAKSVAKPKARVKKAIGKKAPKKTSKGNAKSVSSKPATIPDRRIKAKQSLPEETEDVPEPTETALVPMSAHIAEALQKLGSGDRAGNKKCLVLLEDDETKQKRKNRKNSFYRSLISHLV